MQDTSQSILTTTEEVARQLRVSRTRAFQLITQEGLPFVRLKKSMSVYSDTLRAWMKGRAKSQQ